MEGTVRCLQAVLSEEDRVPQVQEKRQDEKSFAMNVQGEEMFNEWARSAKAGHACEDDAILSTEPLRKPRAQICPYF